MRVDHVSSPGKFQDVSFTLRAGEVLGFAGLVGAGRSEMAQALFGLDPAVTGRMSVGGQPVGFNGPRHAMRAGLGLVPEDRKRQGLVLSMTALANTTLPILGALSRWTFIRRRAERALVGIYFERLRVRAPGLDAVTAGLSGGNQQKLVLAKWLAAHCRILMLDERSRRILVLGTLIALGRFDEFRMHATAAMNEGGFTEDDLKEIVLQQAIYCGVPTAHAALSAVREVLEQLAGSRDAAAL